MKAKLQKKSTYEVTIDGVIIGDMRLESWREGLAKLSNEEGWVIVRGLNDFAELQGLESGEFEVARTSQTLITPDMK